MSGLNCLVAWQKKMFCLSLINLLFHPFLVHGLHSMSKDIEALGLLCANLIKYKLSQ